MIKKIKLPRVHARSISQRFVRSKTPSKQKSLRIYPRAYARSFLRRGIKFQISIFTAYLIIKILALLNKSGASALPGLVAQKICPNILAKLVIPLNKSIIITGTNGKTTSARLIAHYFDQNKISYVHNRIGSNLERGIISSLIIPYIKKKIKPDTWGIFEVDEAAMPKVFQTIRPDYLLITNLFRDQMDRYGEINTILSKWINGLKGPNKTRLILNGNDPSLVFLSQKAKKNTVYFGIKDKNVSIVKLEHTADVLFCPNCQSNLVYKQVIFAHEGHFSCPACDFQTPNFDYWADKLSISYKTSSFLLQKEGIRIKISKFLPGVYNVFNLLSVFSFLDLAGFETTNFNQLMSSFNPAFGRGESFSLGTKSVEFLLIKNPTGLNEVIKRLLHKPEKLNLLIMINDKIADGRDVSWLWDADFEHLFAHTKNLYIAGTRHNDMSLRAKIAGFHSPKNIADQTKAIKEFLSLDEKKLFILPTYSALLNSKKILNKMKLVPKTWHD